MIPDPIHPIHPLLLHGTDPDAHTLFAEANIHISPRKHETLAQRWFTVGPTALTVANS